MKKIKLLICTLSLFLICGLIIFFTTKNTKKYIMHDGIMLALTLDGKNIKSFPEGSGYTVEVDCENSKGSWITETWQLSVSQITGNIICNINFNTKKDSDKLKTIVESNTTKYSGSNDENAGYRYSGKTPNNYVYFNNELWRIIGSIPTKQMDGTITNLVKIIRNDSIGSYAYDAKSSGYTGVWGNNTLYTLLNTHYFATSTSNLNGQNSSGCYSYQNFSRPDCNYNEIGILSTGYYGKMVEQVYWNTGSTNPDRTSGEAYTDEISIQNISGYVGLMLPSDYGYATTSSYHDIDLYDYTGNVLSNNWLFNQGYEWLATADNGTYDTLVDAMAIYNSGNCGKTAGFTSYNISYNGYSVRPVVYLDSNVYVVSGDGTQSNPYQIAM